MESSAAAAGGIDPGETIEQAAVREVAEEIGIECEFIQHITTIEQPLLGLWPRRNHFVHARTEYQRQFWTHEVTGDGDDAGLVFDCGWMPLVRAEIVLGSHQCAAIDAIRP